MVDIFEDMHKMHAKYKVHDAVEKMDDVTLQKFMKFRLDFLMEELNETRMAYCRGDAEEMVDGLIDLIVVAAGTLDLYKVDGAKAWKEVLKANMTKKVGIKEGRPNPLGLPDLMKPEGWVGPSHKGNTGILPKSLG